MLKLKLLIIVVMVICGQATPRPQFGFGGASSFSSAGGIGSFSGAGGGAGVFTGTGGRPGVFPGAGGFGGFGNFGGFGHYGGFGVPFYQPQFINPASFIPQINIPAMPNMVSQAGGVHIFKDGEEITSTFDDTTGTNYQSFFMTTTSDGKNPPKTHMYVNNNGKKIVEEY